MSQQTGYIFNSVLGKKVVPRTYSIRPFMAIGVFLFLPIKQLGDLG
jgi:hypothetical protein